MSQTVPRIDYDERFKKKNTNSISTQHTHSYNNNNANTTPKTNTSLFFVRINNTNHITPPARTLLHCVLALLLPQYPTVGSCCCLFVFKCIWRPGFAPTRVVVRRHRWPEPDSPLITRGLHGPGAFWLLALSSFGVSAPLCGLRLCVDCFACTSVQTGVGPVQRLSNAFAARSCCCCVCVRHRVLWCVDARLMKVMRESCLDRSRKSK